MSEKKGFWDRVRGFVARKTCRLCGVKTGAEALAEKRGGATAAEWRDAAEKLVVTALPALLDEHGCRDVAFTDELRGCGVYGYKYQVVRQALPGVSFDVPDGKEPDYCFFWGFGRSWSNVVSALACARTGCLPVLCEDGFLRSADTWANKSTPPQYRQGCSVIFDTRGFYFDATRTSTVELMLNDRSLVVTDEQRAEARRLIDRIVSAKLTKYNHQPIFTPEVGRPGRRKVLVIDQSYGDFAIRKGWGSDKTFADMLADAKRDNPDCDILVKTHPDTMTGSVQGYYDRVREEGNVFRVTMPINPYSLMEVVDKVYVCSTQLGFEALMAGKEVHVYGMPFYAGWGLTHDAQHKKLRTNKRSLEEVFYIFYVLYTHWVDVKTGKPCGLDVAIDNLIRIRAEYSALRMREKEGRP